ncbi:CHAT domain-containing protein [Terrabacter sp. MAHUQ-38]|uniref:CHAT domain-containing protein n=1 Tax=unclassified Terrabacter TaxID=2630222 RepID=UPI00165E0FA2|nr:CHAT domain-containing protein [Terrabacter sp. MAHUQ-38]MBC9823017.1 CHAT domain-containing protein [Terrabacter sp. MAHUQ-38]
MSRDYLDFDVAVTREGQGYAAHVVASPAGEASAPFTLPFAPVDLAQFMIAVGPPRVASRRLAPAEARVVDVKDYGRRLGDALLSGDVGKAFRASLSTATGQGKDLRLRLRLEAVPDLDPVPWEYLYDSRLGRFLTLSQETPIVRLFDSLERPPVVTVDAPLKVLVMISSPTDMPELAVEREEQLLRATTGDLVASGRLAITVLEDATLTGLQRALLDDYHVFHFIGHGGFDQQAQEGVLVLEREDGTAHRVSGARLGTLLHDARAMQLAVLNACEGARTSGRDAFSGVGQALVRQGLPAVVAMQTEISDRAAIVFSHEFYYFLTRGLGIDAAMCEVRKAMAVSDEASEWGTAVLLRSGSDQPFSFTASATTAATRPEGRLESLYDAAQGALQAGATATALPLLEQVAAERPDYQDVTELLERVRPSARTAPIAVTRRPAPPGPTGPTSPIATGGPDAGADTPSGPALDGGSAPPRVRPTPQPAPVSDRPGGRRSRTATWIRAAVLLAVLVGGWSAWRFLPSLLQKADPLVAAACGSSTAAPGTTDFTIGCAPIAPTIDGSFDDWRSVPEHDVDAAVFGAANRRAGLTATWQGLWDGDGLYLHTVVVDPVVTPAEGKPPQWWNGDAVSFEVGPDPRGLSRTAPLRKGQDFHVILALLSDTDRRAGADVNTVGPNSKNKLVFSTGSRRSAIDVVARVSEGGYELEARIPWSEVGRTVAPQRGDVLGMNVNISDARGAGADWALRTMLSSNAQRSGSNQNLPARWQTVALGDSG